MTATTAQTKRATDNKRVAGVIADHIEALRAEPDERRRERIVATVIEMLYPHFRNWAPTLCRVSGDVTGMHREDVISICAMKVLTVVREAAEPGKHASVSNWYSYLYGICRYASLSYFHSSDVAVASGMTSLLRRQRQLARGREKLRGELGREPEDQELIDSVNADMRSRRSNPEKQGVLVDLTDLQVIVPSADFADHDRAVDDADEAALIAPVEGRVLVEKIVERCTSISPVYGQVAEVWIGRMYAEPPSLGSVADIGEEMSIGSVEAEHLLSTVRGLAVDIARREFGINFPG